MAACMDDAARDPDLKLPEQFENTPIRALRMTSRKKLAQFLNLEGNLIVCEAGLGYGQDELDLVNNYNGLAELVQFDYLEIQNLMRCKSPTEELLEQWTSAPEGGRMSTATVGNLWKFLLMMERFDVLKDCHRAICYDCRIFEEHQAIEQEAQRYNIEQDPTVSNSDMKVDEFGCVDRQSVMEGKSIHYNAFVSYSYEDDVDELGRSKGSSEDLKFVMFLIKELEEKRNLKLFVPGRDDLPGSAFHTITAYLIEEKCDRVILVLSKAFLKSAACDFQLKFAHSLAPGARSKKLIPVLQKRDTHIPRILKFLAVCDFSKTDMRDWVIDRLYSAIIAPISYESFTDQVSSTEYSVEEQIRARRDLESSIYPQSVISPFSPSFRGQSDILSSGFGSITSAASMESMSSLSCSDVDDPNLTSDDTIVADQSISLPSSISGYFPSVTSRSTNPLKPQKGSKGLKDRILSSFGKGRSKKRNGSQVDGSQKDETVEGFRVSGTETMYHQIDPSVRRYNPGIRGDEGSHTVGDSRISTSSEEFVNVDLEPEERGNMEPPWISDEKMQCSPSVRSQTTVLSTRHGYTQGIQPGYRSTNSEVVRKTKPELPPKPRLDQRRSRSPHDEPKGPPTDQQIHFV